MIEIREKAIDNPNVEYYGCICRRIQYIKYKIYTITKNITINNKVQLSLVYKEMTNKHPKHLYLKTIFTVSLICYKIKHVFTV